MRRERRVQPSLQPRVVRRRVPLTTVLVLGVRAHRGPGPPVPARVPPRGVTLAVGCTPGFTGTGVEGHMSTAVSGTYPLERSDSARVQLS